MRRALLTGLVLAGLAGPALAAEPDVLVVTDGEADDAWALAHVAATGRLAGVVGTHRGVDRPASRAVKAATAVLAATGRAGPPVVAGMDGPFGFEQDIKPEAAAGFIAKLAAGRTRERPLRVLLLGPATDLALALVADPGLAGRVEVIGRGFAGWPQGGDAGAVKADVEAWRILLHGSAPLVVCDGAVAARDLTVTGERAKALAGAALAPYAAGGPVRDEAAVAWLLGFATAEDRPRPRLGADARFVKGPVNRAPFKWVTAIDAEATWRDFSRVSDGTR